jgi:hypothetical protein
MHGTDVQADNEARWPARPLPLPEAPYPPISPPDGSKEYPFGVGRD